MACDDILSFLKPFAEVDKHPKNILAPSKECEPGLREPLESEKPVPADLEEAAGEYEKKHTYQRYDGGGFTPEYDETLAGAFIAGYNLCKEQTEKMWLEDRDGCFWDGVEEGKKAMEEQMLKKAVEGTIVDAGFDEHTALVSIPDKRYDEGDKVRIIVCKKED